MIKRLNIYLNLLLVACPTWLTAQQASAVFEKETPITWLGVDFTEARYFGDPGTVDPFEMVRGFDAINDLVVSEPDKFDLRKEFHKNSVMADLSMMKPLNIHLDPMKIKTLNQSDMYRFTSSSIREHIARYDLQGKEGVGALIIMEGLDKSQEQATMWVTFINMKSKEVLLTARVIGKAGGFGFRNHWAGAIHNALEKTGGEEMRKWKKQYGSR